MKHEDQQFKWKKQSALTYSTDRDNEVSKMLVIFLEIESSRKVHHEVKRLYPPPPPPEKEMEKISLAFPLSVHLQGGGGTVTRRLYLRDIIIAII